jgi:hypothetical protein
MAGLTTEEANELLPQEPTKALTNPTRLKYLIIGQPKWGKTTFACSVPNSVLFAFEEGHAFHETHKVIIDAWDKPFSERGWNEDDDGNRHASLVEAVDAICAADRFDFVTLDTADMACKMCLDYHYKKYGVNHAQDAGDYGKGWDICLTQPFRQQIGRIMKSGRGLAFITHSQIITKKQGNVEVSRAETTLPSQAQKFLHTQADVILHGSFGKKVKGVHDRDRVISLDGSNEILAGSRVRGITLPRKFIVDPDHPWQQWVSFFEDPEAVAQADLDYEERTGIRAVDTELAPEPEHETISGSGGETASVATPTKAKPRQRRASR